MQVRGGQVRLPYPVRGMDQSMPRCIADPLTAPNIQNCRAFPPYSDRVSGGKRGGTRRAITSQQSGTNRTRILGLDAKTVGIAAAAPPGASTFLRPISDIAHTAGSVFYVPIPVGAMYAAMDETSPNDFTDFVELIGSATFTVGITNAAAPAANSSVICRFRWLENSVPGVAPREDPGPGVSAFTDTMIPSAIGPVTGTASAASETDIPTVGPITGEGETEVGVHTIEFQLLQSATLIASTGAMIAPALDVWRTTEMPLTPAQIASISDWTVLRIKAIAVGTGTAANKVFDVTWMEVEKIPPAPAAAMSKTLVLSLLDNKCYISDLALDGLYGPSVTALLNAYPCIAYFGDSWYCLDGQEGKKITVNGTGAPTVAAWANVTGTATLGKCRLCCAYQGRIVIARQEGATPNASLYYMSGKFDPTNWTFGSDDLAPEETGAVAGTNKFTGQPADEIVALIPWGDDMLLFMGGSTIWAMAGDPGFQGVVKCISRQTGIIGQRAWAFDEWGNLWFVGSGGLYKMAMGGPPVPVSGRRLYRNLDRLDGNNNLVQLAYDAFEKVLRIFITPTDTTLAGGHIVYDVVADSFVSFDVYPSRMGPWSVCQLSGQHPDDRRFLIGGDDGYMRRPFDGGLLTAAGIFAASGTARYGVADDMLRPGTGGEAIECAVRYAPIEYPGGEKRLMAMGLFAVGTDPNLPVQLPISAVTWYWLTGDSLTTVAEQANYVATGTWFGPSNVGRQGKVGLRRAAAAHGLMIRHHSSTHSWAIDAVYADFQPLGPERM